MPDFPTFSRVRSPAEAVHGDSQGGVCFFADRSVRHCTGREPPDDGVRRLHFIQRDRLPQDPQAQQPSQRCGAARLLVDRVGVFLEERVLATPSGVLQLEDGLGCEEVTLAVATPPVSASGRKVVYCVLGRLDRSATGERFALHTTDVESTNARWRAGEVGVHERAVQANRLEDLGTPVAANRRDAHLGHDLHQALVERAKQVAGGDRGVHVDGGASARFCCGVTRKIRVDGVGAVAEQQRTVMHFSGIRRFDDKPAAAAQAKPDERVVNGRRGEQARNTRRVRCSIPVRQEQNSRSAAHRRSRRLLQPDEGLFQTLRSIDREERLQHGGAQALDRALTDAGQVGIADDWLGQAELATGGGRWLEKVRFRSDSDIEGRHERFADGIEGRVRHLREALREVVEQQAGALGQNRQRRYPCPSSRSALRRSPPSDR